MGGPIWLAEINDHNYVKQISDLIDAPDTNLVLASEKKNSGAFAWNFKCIIYLF